MSHDRLQITGKKEIKQIQLTKNQNKEKTIKSKSSSADRKTDPSAHKHNDLMCIYFSEIKIFNDEYSN